MLSKQKIKRQINNITHIADMLYSTELVSASRLRRSQTKLKEIAPYCDTVEALLRDLINSLDREKLSRYPLLNSSYTGSIDLLIVVGGERGLCGGYIADLIRICENYINSNPNSDIIVYGTRVGRILYRRGYNILAVHPINPLISFNDIRSILEDITERFKTGKYRRVTVEYVSPQSAFSSIPKEVPLLPIETDTESLRSMEEYIIEPSPEIMLESLLPMALAVRLYRIFLESITSEYSARRFAMHQAYENAREILRKLNIVYQKLRQSEITTEIIEVSTSKVALEEGML
ncbi:F0F1 ATP synthase subunit gamma [bacterium]|nr:F0F1 ATP synthase subunit gamma [bacterium]